MWWINGRHSMKTCFFVWESERHWPSPCGGHALSLIRSPDSHQKAARRKSLSPTDNHLLPLATLSHQACQEINLNTANRAKSQTQCPLWHKWYWLTILFCLHNFMHLHLRIDYSLMHGAFFISQMKFHDFDVISKCNCQWHINLHIKTRWSLSFKWQCQIYQ